MPRLRAVAHVLRRQVRGDLQRGAVVGGAAEGVVAGVHQRHLANVRGFEPPNMGKRWKKVGKGWKKGWEKDGKKDWNKDGISCQKSADSVDFVKVMSVT